VHEDEPTAGETSRTPENCGSPFARNEGAGHRYDPDVEPADEEPLSAKSSGREQEALVGSSDETPGWRKPCSPEAAASTDGVRDDIAQRMGRMQTTNGKADDRFVVPGATAEETMQKAMTLVTSINGAGPESAQEHADSWLRHPHEVRRLALGELGQLPRQWLTENLRSRGYCGLHTSVVTPAVPPVLPATPVAVQEVRALTCRELHELAESIWAAPLEERRSMLRKLPAAVKRDLAAHIAQKSA